MNLISTCRTAAFSSVALAALLLTACKEEKTTSYSRIPEVPGADTAATPMTAASSENMSASPHGANPHAGLLPGQGGDTSGSASMGSMGGQGMQLAPPKVDVHAGGNILEAAGVAFTIPESWKKEEAANAMRLAQYSIPGDAGPAELVLFYFGKGQGGSVEQNVRRWAGQFKSDDPTTTTTGADVAEFENGGLHVALVKTSGTYNPGSMGPMMGGGAPAEPKPNWALFGLVIEGGPEGSLFVKVTGPKATLDAQSKNLEAFAQSVRKSQFK